MQKHISELALYKLRYVLGYTFGAIVIIGGLLFAAMYAPGGLRQEEMNASVTSGSLAFKEFDPHAVINLPYHLLQRLSFAIFDVSILSIKLPSLFLGVLAVIGIFLLVREWFKKNIAIITVIIAATTPIFVFASQDGTPLIYAIAISIWLLHSATMVSRHKKPTLLWKILLFLLLALNTYTPLGIYLNLAIVSTFIFHPHIRYIAKKISPSRVVLAVAISLVALVPFLYSVSTHPSIGLELLGVPSSMPDIKANVLEIGRTLFTPSNEHAAGILRPLLSLGVLTLVALGVYRFILLRYMARSYVLWFWLIALTPLIILNPQYIYYILPLVIIFIAMAISSLVYEWYKLFPLNPYARVAGLLPLSVIVVSVVSSGFLRYTLGYTYLPEVASHYSTDVRLIDKAIARAGKQDAAIPLVVPASQLQFYTLYAKYNEKVAPTTALPESTVAPKIITGSMYKKDPSRLPTYIITDTKSHNSARFYVYTTEK